MSALLVCGIVYVASGIVSWLLMMITYRIENNVKTYQPNSEYLGIILAGIFIPAFNTICTFLLLFVLIKEYFNNPDICKKFVHGILLVREPKKIVSKNDLEEELDAALVEADEELKK